MKKIALVDPLTGGHHLSFIRLFAQAFLELGHEVVVYYPEPEDVALWITEKFAKKEPKISFFKSTVPHVQPRWMGRFNQAFTAAMKWRAVNKTIKQTWPYETDPDIVFFAWMDSFIANYFPLWIHRTLFSYKWSGLYFHPYHLRLSPESLTQKARISSIDHLFLAGTCKSIAIHDAHVAQDFAKNRLSGKSVFVLPETADNSPIDPENIMAKEITAKANGRCIIGAIGLAPHQGLATLVALAQKAASEHFFFVFIGKLDEKWFEERERPSIISFFKSGQENCFFHFDSIPEGSFYNSVFNSLDIIFLVYNNFVSTSNRLTKAAIFEKFVLASNQHCIGQDVEKFELGLTVESKNVAQALKTIDLLKDELNGASKRLDPKFADYVQINNFENLKSQLANCIE